MDKVLTLTMTTPLHSLMKEEQVRKVLLPTKNGMEMILYDRAPLFKKIEQGKLTCFYKGGISRSFFISEGVCEVRENKVSITAQHIVDAHDKEALFHSLEVIKQFSKRASSAYVQSKFQKKIDDLEQLLKLFEEEPLNNLKNKEET